MSLDIEIPLITATLATAVAAYMTRFMKPMLMEQRVVREKRRDKVCEVIRSKIKNGITIDAQEVIDIGKGLNVSSSMAIDALYQLYAEAESPEDHEKLKLIIQELGREEPFESYPAEVRPSLARLSALCATSTQEADRTLLHPITKIIEDYQEMKQDHAGMKRQSRISYVVALVSFFLGVVGLVLAFTGPSKKFVSQTIERATTEIQQTIETQQGNREVREKAGEIE